MRAKEITKKIPVSKVKAKVEDLDTDKDTIPVKKSLKPIEIDEEVPAVVDVEEKVAEDAVVDAEVEEADDAGLTDEDLDPFGDKWEV